MASFVTERWKPLPLTEPVNFKSKLQKGNRIQVPKLIRWLFKLEPTQTLKVEVRPEGSFEAEEFYVCMKKDGRITIPKLILQLLEEDEEESLVDYVLNVSLEPCSSAWCRIEKGDWRNAQESLGSELGYIQIWNMDYEVKSSF